MTLIVLVYVMPWPQKGATHCYKQLGRAINRLVLCYLVWLGSIKEMVLTTFVRCMGLVPYCGQYGYQAQEPQHPI